MRNHIKVLFVLLALAMTAATGYSNQPDRPTARAVIQTVPGFSQGEPSGAVLVYSDVESPAFDGYEYHSLGVAMLRNDAVCAIAPGVLWDASGTPASCCSFCENDPRQRLYSNGRYFQRRGPVPVTGWNNHGLKHYPNCRNVLLVS